MRVPVRQDVPKMKSARIAVMAVCVLFLVVLAPALAQGPNVAGLIVDYGDGRVSYAVIPFEEDQINGLDLLSRSGFDVVSVGFGGLGDAVCQVGNTGCSVDDCRTRMCQTSDADSPFWQFSKLGDDGEWLFVATGASGARVHDGDIYAWSWVGTEPSLPVMTIDELIERAGADPAAMNDLQAHLRTEGESPADDDGGTGVLAVAAIGVVLVAAGFLVVRSRLSRPTSHGSDER
jgi:hypothetical protein